MLPWVSPFQGIPVKTLSGVSPELLSRVWRSVGPFGPPRACAAEYRSAFTWFRHGLRRKASNGRNNPHRVFAPARPRDVRTKSLPGYGFTSRRAMRYRRQADDLGKCCFVLPEPLRVARGAEHSDLQGSRARSVLRSIRLRRLTARVTARGHALLGLAARSEFSAHRGSARIG
jgi:hypothetical protein